MDERQHTPTPVEHGESPCWCGSDACIGAKHLLAGFHCARRANDAKTIAGHQATITALVDGLKFILEHSGDPVMENVAIAALALVPPAAGQEK